jgi:hypothetical protein
LPVALAAGRAAVNDALVTGVALLIVALAATLFGSLEVWMLTVFDPVAAGFVIP